MARPRVLLAWEFGRNLGHLSRLIAIARLLEDEGCEPVWVIPENAVVAKQKVLEQYRVHVAPRIQSADLRPAAQVHSFADILLSFGFGDAHALNQSVQRWCTLIAELDPVSVVFDYAPTAQLAAQILGLPAFQVTNGFDAPPPDCPVFGITMRGPLLERLNAEKLAILDRSLDVLAKARGQPQLADRRDFFDYAVKVYDCLGETDPYGPREGGLCVGPLGGAADAVLPVWPDVRGSEKKVFAYLRGQTNSIVIAGALREIAAACLCVWPDAPPEWLSRHSDGQHGLRIQNMPVRMTDVLSEADVVVTYGPTTTACQTVLAGLPQLIAPEDIEKRLVADRLVKCGAALTINSLAPNQHVSECLELLLSSSTFRSEAQKIAGNYSRVQFADAAKQLVKLAAGGSSLLPNSSYGRDKISIR